jgi:AGCS family alanine or glycine:cation symporter
MGSSPLAHGTSSEKDSDIQGRWGIFEIFFDSFIVSTLTALAIISSSTGDMESVFLHNWGRIGGFLFSLTVSLLAFASVISWCYYAHCCLDFLFPKRALPQILYGFMFSLTSALGIFMNTQQIWEISDILNALMMMPNLFLLFKCRKEIERI